MLIKKGKFYDLASDAVHKYDDVHQDIFWYLLELTAVNRVVNRVTLREFLIRYFLITDTPLENSAINYIDEGILVSGTIDDKYFEFKVSDIFCFLGYSTTDQNYHINCTIEQFISKYKNLKYLVKYEKIDNKIKMSKDTFMIMFLGVHTLIEIDTLNIRFRDDLTNLDDNKFESVVKFVDFVVNRIPDEMFDNYLKSQDSLLEKYQDYKTVKELIDFDPLLHLSSSDFAFIYEIFIGEDQELVKKLRSGEELDEDLKQDFAHYLKYIKYAWGVKHGYIKVDNNWHSSLEDNYAPEFNIDPIEDFCGEDFEVLSTEYIFQSWEMDKWMHLIP